MIAVLLFASLCSLLLLLSPPERVLFETFSIQQLQQSLPPQCRDTFSRFHHCQSTSQKTRVLACHRAWCHSTLLGGHCEPCSGVGDRTHHLLHLVQNATLECARIQLDYPIPGIAMYSDAVYTDPGGWWAHWLHFRSYNVSDRKRLNASLPVAYAHFYSTWLYHPPPLVTADGDYDKACLWPILFQPTRSLQRQLAHHNRQIGGRSIGIHFRTGDAHLGIANEDVRVSSDHLQGALDKMMACAAKLAQQLFGTTSGEDDVTYFLATDNPLVKEMVRGNAKIYTTPLVPQTFLAGNAGDQDAMLELYLLSQRDGLVANVNPNAGKIGERLSTFFQVAKMIGFLKDSQVMECDVEA